MSKTTGKPDQMEWVKKRRRKNQKNHPKRVTFSGFCNNGHCEGTRPKNYRGVPLKTCHLYLECQCVCHIEQDELFESLGMERRLVENPEYKVPKPTFVMPDPHDFDQTEWGAPIKRVGPIDRQAIAGEALTGESILKGRVFHETDSGRRARGALEYQVLEACNKAMDVWPDELEITPRRIAEYIGNKQGGEPPSSGAVDAVWKRWVKMGFAETASNPVRFVDYTAKENQTIEQLEAAKTKFKRSLESARGEARRTIRRK